VLEVPPSLRLGDEVAALRAGGTSSTSEFRLASWGRAAAALHYTQSSFGLTVHCERVTPFGGPPFACGSTGSPHPELVEGWTESPVTRAFRGKPNAGAPGAVSRDGVAAGENGGRPREHNSLVVNPNEYWD